MLPRTTSPVVVAVRPDVASIVRVALLVAVLLVVMLSVTACDPCDGMGSSEQVKNCKTNAAHLEQTRKNVEEGTKVIPTVVPVANGMGSTDPIGLLVMVATTIVLGNSISLSIDNDNDENFCRACDLPDCGEAKRLGQCRLKNTQKTDPSILCRGDCDGCIFEFSTPIDFTESAMHID